MKWAIATTLLKYFKTDVQLISQNTKSIWRQYSAWIHQKWIMAVRRVARNLHWGEGLFWRLETTSNDLDPDFRWSSLRLSRFLSPNSDDLQKKRSSPKLGLFLSKFRWSPKKKKEKTRSSPKLRRFFCPNLGDLKKQTKSLHPDRNPVFLVHIKFLTNSHPKYHWEGAIFVFSAKNPQWPEGYFAYSSGHWGGGARAPPLATLLMADLLFDWTWIEPTLKNTARNWFYCRIESFLSE